MTAKGERYEASDGTEIEVVERQQRDYERWCWVEFRYPDGTSERGRVRPKRIMAAVSDGDWTPVE